MPRLSDKQVLKLDSLEKELEKIDSQIVREAIEAGKGNQIVNREEANPETYKKYLKAKSKLYAYQIELVRQKRATFVEGKFFAFFT